jgi:hypothetical protein
LLLHGKGAGGLSEAGHRKSYVECEAFGLMIDCM